MRLLIVDDSEDARDVLAATLAAGGYEDVTPCESGAKALELLGVGNGEETPPAFDLILCDIVMPGIDGIEATARLRQDPRFQDVPVIMVTSLDDMSSLAQAFVAGANDYVTKPFERTELLVRVRNALKLKGELERRLKREEELRAANDRLKAAQEPAFNAIDKATGFLSREAFEDLLRDGTLGLGWTALLQLDAYDNYRSQYGDAAASALARRLCASVSVTRGPLGSLVSDYEDGLVAIAFPPLADGEVRRILEAVRAVVAESKVAHRDSAVSGVVTVSAGYAPHDGGRHGLALANAFSALHIAAARGDSIEQFQEPQS